MSLPLELDGAKPLHDTLDHPGEVHFLWEPHWGSLLCSNSGFSGVYQSKKLNFQWGCGKADPSGITLFPGCFHSDPALPIPAASPSTQGFVGKLHGAGLDKTSGSCWCECAKLPAVLCWLEAGNPSFWSCPGEVLHKIQVVPGHSPHSSPRKQLSVACFVGSLVRNYLLAIVNQVIAPRVPLWPQTAPFWLWDRCDKWTACSH